MKTDLMTRVNDNPVVNFGRDQLRRQWLASLGLMSMGVSVANSLISDPRKTTTRCLSLWPEAWQAGNDLFADLVKKGRRRRPDKAKHPAGNWNA